MGIVFALADKKGTSKNKRFPVLRTQQRPGFVAQTLDHVSEIDPPQWPAFSRSPMQPWQGLHVMAAQEQIQPVMAQVHRQLLADQPRGDAAGD